MIANENAHVSHEKVKLEPIDIDAFESLSGRNVFLDGHGSTNRGLMIQCVCTYVIDTNQLIVDMSTVSTC